MTRWLTFLAKTATVAIIFAAAIFGIPYIALALGVPLR